MRLPYSTLSSEAYAGLLATKKSLDKSTLGRSLIEIIYLRVSQINGCSFCLEMHAKSLRSSGIDLEKIDAVAGWRVSGRFSEKERAALNWCESLVYIAKTYASDQDYDLLRGHFSDVEISDLTFAVATMSAFNRLAIGMRQ